MTADEPQRHIAASPCVLRSKELPKATKREREVPGGVEQIDTFRDALPDFSKTGATVIGVSRDSAASHDKFKRKHGLPFPLAADVDGKVCEAYGTWVEKSMYGRTYMGIERATFLIDGKGAIRRVWRKVKVPGHVDEVLAAARAL